VVKTDLNWRCGSESGKKRGTAFKKGIADPQQVEKPGKRCVGSFALHDEPEFTESERSIRRQKEKDGRERGDLLRAPGGPKTTWNVL